jgi:hypothetical protein
MRRDNEETYIPYFARDEGERARYRVCRENGSEYLGSVRIEPPQESCDRGYYVTVADNNGSTTRDPFLRTVQGIFSKESYALDVRYK